MIEKNGFDYFRKGLTISVTLVLLCFANVFVDASHEFQVFRMQQYDMPFGNYLGSRSNQISFDARTINSKQISRKCVLVKLDDLSLERYRILVSQYAAAIIVLLPENYDDNHKATIKSLENQLLHEEVKIPVYFIQDSPEINKFYEYIESESSSQAEVSAFQTLINSVISNGFQFVINSAQSHPITRSQSDFLPVNIQGVLNGRQPIIGDDQSANSAGGIPRNQKIPTIIITAHYDAFGLATSLSYGCDSNGSGVVALLELARILSLLYGNSKTIPPLNVLFLLTAEGKFNYHGLKKWIEEQSETNEIAGKIDLDDVLFAICLDSLGKPSEIEGNLNSLFMHVSRQPKEGQASYELLRILENQANQSNIHFSLIHKKINLATDLLAWEHERFSLNKIPAFTLSHFKSFKDSDRTSITDKLDSLDKNYLLDNIRLLAHTLVRFIYRNEDISKHILTDDLNVSEEFVSSWLDKICNIPRTASLINKNHPLVTNLFAHFNRYLQEPLKFPVKVQSKEPEFVFYNEEQANLLIYSVKPAVFDFFLALLIAGYIGLVYLLVTNFLLIFKTLNSKLSSNRRVSNSGVTSSTKSKTF